MIRTPRKPPAARRIAGPLLPALAALVLAWMTLAAGCARHAEPRLVLLLTSDTLRADRIGAYGGSLNLTPHLDALLRDSVLFETAYAPCSYTLPSVSALMTGRYPEELGLLTNASRMGSEYATLASVLRLYGWRTGAAVSNYVLRDGTGFEKGFERYDATFPQREANRDMPERIAADTTDAALSVLDALRGGDAPVFLWVHYQDPHGPYLPPDGYRERYLEAERARPDGTRELPAHGSQRGFGSIPAYQLVEGERQVAFYRAGYAGEIARLDEEIGRLLDGLADRGLRDGAAVVFTADHGEGLGEDDYWFAHGEYLTDPLVRVPLAIRAPGLRPARRTDPTSMVDLFPTVLGIAGVEAPPGYPGRDLLEEGAADRSPEIYLAGLRHATVPRFGLVADGYKYLTSDEQDGTVESLHRLGEGDRDRASEEPERLADMRRRLERFRGQLRSAPERRQTLSKEERSHLESLGYVIE
jgi:arylsulfatase